jgi:hypothetical protein
MGAWLELLRSSGQALLEVFRVELAELGGDLGRSGRHLLRAVVFFLVAAFLGFWTVVVLFYFLFQLLSLWLSPVMASGLVLLLFLVAVGILGLLGYLQLRKCENPAVIVKRHLDDHTAWWNERLLPSDGVESPATRPPAGQPWEEP